MRYMIVGNDPNHARSKAIKKLTDSDRRVVPSNVKMLRLSQGHGLTTLDLKVQQYNPKEGDKVEYSWVDEFGDEESYQCPNFALADLEHVQITLERFLDHNLETYSHNILAEADPITKKVFETAIAQSQVCTEPFNPPSWPYTVERTRNL